MASIGDIAGDMARQMASAPVVTETAEQKETRQRKSKNPFAVLGEQTFSVGDGKRYARTSGWGANRVPHPGGGTNETIAWVTFKPFPGTDITLEGRIYCERYVENGEEREDYSVSFPFLKAERRDTRGRDAIESLKLSVWDEYVKWLKTAKPEAQQATTPTTRRKLTLPKD